MKPFADPSIQWVGFACVCMCAIHVMSVYSYSVGRVRMCVYVRYTCHDSDLGCVLMETKA